MGFKAAEKLGHMWSQEVGVERWGLATEGKGAVWMVHVGKWLSRVQVSGYPGVGGSTVKRGGCGLVSGDSRSDSNIATCLLPVMG